MKRPAQLTKPSPSAKAAEELRLRAEAELHEFGAQQEAHPIMSDLYRRAKARLRSRRKNQKSKAAAAPPAVDPQRLVHELEVHQVELEMQNAELVTARDRMESLLEKFTDLYDFAPVGYFTLAANCTIQQVNLTGTRLVGIERSRLVGQLFGVLVAPELRPALHAFLKEVFAGQAKHSGDFLLLNPGQPPRAVNLEAQRSANGRECRVAVMDISERKLVEARVRVSEVRYRRLFETAHDGVLILDPATCKITDANPFMTTLLGYPHTQLVGKELFEIGLLKDQAASQEMFRKLKKSHEVRYEDLPLESWTGRHQEVEVVANLYRENGHDVIQCNIRDITERKRAEALLRRTEAMFSDLVARAPVGVYVVDARFQLQQVNPTALPAFINVRPLLGRDFSEVMHVLWSKRIAAQVVARFRHTLKTGEPYQATEFAERRRDTGVKEAYEWQIQRVTLPAGEHGVVCFFSDITERKRTEEAQRRVAVLSASNAKLEQEILRRQAVEKTLMQSEQHQRQLLAQARLMQEQLRQLSRQVLRAQEEERKRISRELHDVIAQTLTSISVRLTVLKREAMLKTDDFERSIVRTQQLVEQSVDIVHKFARDLRPAALDDLGLIPALHAHLKSFVARTGIRTSLTAIAEVEQLDSARRTVLFRVAQEALTNIARHSQAAQAWVKIEKLKGALCMKITDDGKGFPAERMMESKKARRLGLLGMRERMEMVNGSLVLESAPGKGTTVRAQIPFGGSPAQNGKKGAVIRKRQKFTVNESTL